MKKTHSVGLFLWHLLIFYLQARQFLAIMVMITMREVCYAI